MIHGRGPKGLTPAKVSTCVNLRGALVGRRENLADGGVGDPGLPDFQYLKKGTNHFVVRSLNSHRPSVRGIETFAVKLEGLEWRGPFLSCRCRFRLPFATDQSSVTSDPPPWYHTCSSPMSMGLLQPVAGPLASDRMMPS